MDTNKAYNFSTLAPAILGAFYKNMTVVSTMNYEEAIAHRDVQRTHSALLSVIANLPDIKWCLFYKFKNNDGESVILAREYIDLNTITEVTGVNIRATLYGVTSEDMAVIKNRFTELGYNNVLLELV